jgi:hypothetical protein
LARRNRPPNNLLDNNSDDDKRPVANLDFEASATALAFRDSAAAGKRGEKAIGLRVSAGGRAQTRMNPRGIDRAARGVAGGRGLN